MKLSKNIFYKSWAPKLKFFNEIIFRKIQIILDIENWLWKSEFCNSAGLITSTKNVQKNFQRYFCDQWSISFSLKSFYQIPLTWSKYYSKYVINGNSSPQNLPAPFASPLDWHLGPYSQVWAYLITISKYVLK